MREKRILLTISPSSEKSDCCLNWWSAFVTKAERICKARNESNSAKHWTASCTQNSASTGLIVIMANQTAERHLLLASWCDHAGRATPRVLHVTNRSVMFVTRILYNSPAASSNDTNTRATGCRNRFGDHFNGSCCYHSTTLVNSGSSTLDFGTVYLLTSGLPRHSQHFVKSWKLIYFGDLTQTLCYNYVAIVVLEVTLTQATMNSFLM